MQIIKPASVDLKVVTLIDVRSPAEYRAGHAVGAMNVPLDSFDPFSLPDAKPVVLICKSGVRASKAAEKCSMAGRSNTFVVEGGTQAWEAAGLPVVRGKAVIPMERQVLIGAGSIMLIGLILSWTVHPAFVALSTFVGVGLVFAGVTGFCGMAIVLGEMPWNK